MCAGPGANPNYVYWGVTARFVNKGDVYSHPMLRQPDRDLCLSNIAPLPTFLCNRQFASMHAGDGGNWARADGSVADVSADLDGAIYEALCTITGDDEAGGNRKCGDAPTVGPPGV